MKRLDRDRLDLEAPVPGGQPTPGTLPEHCYRTRPAAVHPRYHSFPPERLADAHLAVEEGAIGKVIVELGG